MAFPKGTYLNGIRTLEDLRLRCVMDRDTDCWRWKGALSDGVPHVCLHDAQTGKHRVTTGPRAAALLSGREIPEGRIAYRTCCTKACVNPDHIAVGTKKQLGLMIRRKGTQRNNPLRSLINARNSRRRVAKLNMDIARQIRESDEPGVVWARRLGVCAQTISAVRTGKRWVEAQNASVFGWRPAA